jgi:hypothetical protein
MVGSHSATTLMDDAFRASLDGEVLNVGEDAWEIVLDYAGLGHGRLWVQLTVCGPSLWLLTLSLPRFADRLQLLAAVAMFLRQPEDEHGDVVTATRVAPLQRI